MARQLQFKRERVLLQIVTMHTKIAGSIRSAKCSNNSTVSEAHQRIVLLGGAWLWCEGGLCMHGLA